MLVVEDDQTTRQMLRRLLEKEGCLVSEAENGRVALHRLEQCGQAVPSLILLDLMMPEMDGFAFVRECRAHEQWRNIPIVVVTAKDLTEAERQRLSGQVQRVLQKGAYALDTLLNEVRQLVAQRPTAATAQSTRKE